MEEHTYDEVDYILTLKKVDEKEIAESEFNSFTAKIESEMSKNGFLVIIKKLDPEDIDIIYSK
jgi:hypothetical protein